MVLIEPTESYHYQIMHKLSGGSIDISPDVPVKLQGRPVLFSAGKKNKSPSNR